MCVGPRTRHTKGHTNTPARGRRAQNPRPVGASWAHAWAATAKHRPLLEGATAGGGECGGTLQRPSLRDRREVTTKAWAARYRERGE